MDDTIVEIIPPEPATDTPVSQAILTARTALSGAMGVLRAAHRGAIASLDQVMDSSLIAAMGDDSPSGSPATDKAVIQSMREEALSRMEKRSWMLADALQRSAIMDIASADSAVFAIRHAVATARNNKGGAD